MNYISICVAVKDEIDLLEWCAYNFIIGFDHIYLYDNGSKVSVKTRLKNFRDRVTVVDFPSTDPNRQRMMYQHFKDNYGKETKWVAIIDVDEFICLKKHKNIKALVKSVSGAEAISISMVYFGSNNHNRRPEGLVIENYTSHLSVPNSPEGPVLPLNFIIKSIVKVSKVKKFNVHYHKMANPSKYFNLVGNLVDDNLDCNYYSNSSKTFVYEIAQLNHYNIKSLEDYIYNRLIRQQCTNINRDMVRFHKINDNCKSVDMRMIKMKYPQKIREFLKSHNLPELDINHPYHLPKNWDSNSDLELFYKLEVPLRSLFPKGAKYYFPDRGISGCVINTHTPFVAMHEDIFFKIIEKYSLEYVIFAGASIGCLRNNKSIPWSDDIDIMINTNQISLLKNKIIPILEKNNFRVSIFRQTKDSAGFQVYSVVSCENRYFQCDIFVSYIDKKDIIRNSEGWGLYHKKNIPKSWVWPPVKKIFNGKSRPFFREMTKDIEKEYGDVINVCKIHLDHKGKNLTINYHWKQVYDEYEKIINEAIEATKSKIFINPDYKPIEKLEIKEAIPILELLKLINIKNIGTLYMDGELNIKHTISIKYYFPDIKIIVFFIENPTEKIIHYLNYVDQVNVKTHALENLFRDKEIFYLKKPIIKLTRVITFGTFDLFHIGHKNILNHCNIYSENVIVGVSTDKLNEIKGKKAFQNQEIRKSKVSRSGLCSLVFDEESLELKSKYISDYDADILIMGDDWKGHFDSSPCRVIYIPRTKFISSTDIRKDIQYCINTLNEYLGNEHVKININLNQ